MLESSGLSNLGRRTKPIKGCFRSIQETESRLNVVASDITGLLIEITLGQRAHGEATLIALAHANNTASVLRS